MGLVIHSTVTALSTSFIFFSAMPSRILALGGESKSQGTSSSSLYLQITHISNKAPGKAPLDPSTLYI